MSSKDQQGVVDGILVSAKDIAAGSVGGVAQCLTGHPLDTIKVRLQTQSHKYNGMMHCATTTVKEEGFVGLYKGIQSPLVGLTVFNAIQFLSYGQIKSAIKAFDSDADKNLPLTLKQYVVAGTLVGFTVAFIETPIDFLKSQLQIQGVGSTKYSGLIDCAMKIKAERGLIPGWYQGFTATMIRDVPANAAYFGIYELTRKWLRSADETPDKMASWKILVSGGAGGVAYWASTFPLDVIKSSIQTDNIDPAQRKYKNWLDCASKIYQTQGTKGFFRGFAPCIIRAAPANAACFWAYEQTKKLLG